MINFIIHKLGFGGAERVLSELANEMSRTQNVVIYCRDIKNFAYQLDEKITMIEFKSYFKLAKRLKGNKAIVFVYPVGTLLLLYNWMFNFNSFYILRHANNYKRFEKVAVGTNVLKRGLLLIYFNINIRFIKFYHHHIVLNSNMKYHLENVWGVKNSKITIIKNPVNLKFINAKPIGDKIDVLFIGRLIKSKGILDLTFFIQRLPELNFTIIGDGPFRKDIMELQNQNQNLIYIPKSDSVLKYYKNTKILVLPSYKEGSPNVIIEALAVGIPVIAYDCETGPGELIKNNTNGFLVTLGDKTQFLEKIKTSINKNWNRKEIKSTIKSHATDKVSEEYVNILKD